MDMTKERLEMYRSNNDEIKELRAKLQKMGTEEGKEKLVESDTIIDYRKGLSTSTDSNGI